MFRSQLFDHLQGVVLRAWCYYYCNNTKHEGRTLEGGQTTVTETCRVLIMSFTNIFNNLEF